MRAIESAMWILAEIVLIVIIVIMVLFIILY